MTKIVRGGLSGAADNLGSSQGNFRAQISALIDAVRQLGGNAEIGPGSIVNDPLSAPYVLYVNPYTGSDTFVSGSYSTTGGATKRIELQRLECGYSPTRPFKTVNRAVIEAGIITAKSFYQSPLGNADLVSIVLAPGADSLLNGTGSASVAEWEGGKAPTDAELQAFNPSATGGILLPRGASLVALHGDLRKTILRPSFVPAPADEAPDTSNRRTIFKVTGTGFCYGLTFMDKVGSTSSHHLLSCFDFATQAELDEFYAKIRQAFGGAGNTGGLDPLLAVTRTGEYQIVGPRPASGGQTIATDTTESASPYIFNCSIRSNYGLCGAFADGAKPSGFKSMVIAQLTGVSLQRDLSCWQKYDSTQSPMWGNYFTNYADYINSDPNNVRMNPARRSFHVRAINNAIIQEVSVFAIGQGIHHWTQSGGELTVTNSNSNFGGCAALAEGYKNTAFVSDSNWNIGSIRTAINLADKRNNVRKIYLGTVASGVGNSATTIQLTADLEDSATNPGVPKVLDRDGYSLLGGSYIWIENSRGLDYRAQLSISAWNSSQPDEIIVTSAFQNQDGIVPGASIVNSQGYDTGQDWPSLAGARIYVRRLQDVRTIDERRYSLRCNNSDSRARTPLRDYVLQTSPGSGGVVTSIADDKIITVAAASAINPDGAGVVKSASVELRRNNSSNEWTSGVLYRLGDTARYQNKTYSCTFKHSGATFNPQNWQEIFVHMGESFKPEDYWKNTQPAVVFDNDSDGNDNTETCGYNLLTVWSTDARVQAQYRTATDYRGVHALLVALGFGAADAHTILLPRATGARERDPAAALDGISAPLGAASAWANWPIEFRRPSNIRLFGHAWEWSGFLNYSKALPEYQLDLTALNKFTYYFTSQNGGRVYGSGFNEEGFLVTPQGLQDLSTGNEIAFEAIAESNVDIDQIQFPTSYNELDVGQLTVNTELNLLSSVITGTPSWEGGFGGALPALPSASAVQKGIIEIATAAEVQEFLRDDLAVTPSTLIQALGDAIKSVANLRLSLSATNPVPSENQLNSTNLYIHPYNGNEIAIYSTASLRWQVVRFSGVKTFSLAPCNAANTNYDIYLYNSGTPTSPILAIEYVSWPGDLTPPTRDNQDGVIVRNGDPSKRFVGIVRTTSAGTSTIDLGGIIYGTEWRTPTPAWTPSPIPADGSANFPKIYLANLFNVYDASATYFFGTAWQQNTSGWSSPPSSIYSVAPRISWVQANPSLATAYLDIYSNYSTENFPAAFSVLYVAPGIDSLAPPTDAFYGETIGSNDTAGSQWSRSLAAGKHDLFYLYQCATVGGSAVNLANEHPSHGAILSVKV